MKKYNLNPIEQEFEWGKMNILKLGQSGRGRQVAIIPYHADEIDEYVEIGKSKAGNPKIVKSNDSTDWVAVLSGCGCYTRNTYGTVYTPTHERIQIVAVGRGAYGAAGRVGSFYEYLCIILDNTFVKVRPSGGAHKIPRYWVWFGKEKAFKIYEPEMPLFCENLGVDQPPEEFEKLTDLISLYKS